MLAKTYVTWPQGWAVVFATFAHGGTIFGKVRLNKHLAILQREGFPVPNKFVIKEMGPHDGNIDAETSWLKGKDFLDVVTKPSGKSFDRVEYRLTRLGREFVTKSVIPLIRSLPYQHAIHMVISSTNHLFVQKTEKIVESLHKEMFLDNKTEFANQLSLATKDTQSLFERSERARDLSCEYCMDLLGSLDFSLRCLIEVRKGHLDDRFAGKHHVLFNATKLAQIVEESLGHTHVPQVSDVSDQRTGLSIEMLKHRLRAMEFNADLYGILTPIDPYTYDFPEFVVAT